jgi:hypothetical protein
MDTGITTELSQLHACDHEAEGGDYTGTSNETTPASISFRNDFLQSYWGSHIHIGT